MNFRPFARISLAQLKSHAKNLAVLALACSLPGPISPQAMDIAEVIVNAAIGNWRILLLLLSLWITSEIVYCISLYGDTIVCFLRRLIARCRVALRRRESIC